MEVRKDLNYTIMKERLEAGVEMAKELAAKHDVAFDKDVLIKGLEIGISLFIQKNKEYINR